MSGDTEHLDALIAKLEGASEGSRELDGLIWQALNPDLLFMVDSGDVRPPKRPARYEPFGSLDIASWTPELRRYAADAMGAPKLTSSLDAAMTLVPEGWDHGVAHVAAEGSNAAPEGEKGEG